MIDDTELSIIGFQITVGSVVADTGRWYCLRGDSRYAKIQQRHQLFATVHFDAAGEFIGKDNEEVCKELNIVIIYIDCLI
eukprot:SAG11_NODE_20181_length_451_cov_0.590909_1_plen_80_part_00